MLSTALIALAMTLVPTTSALGCYSGGLVWSNLHGGTQAIDQEVLNDITTTCQKAAGKTIRPSEPFRLCTNWKKTKSDHDGCYDACIDGCGAIPGGRAGDIAVSLCKSGCDENCANDMPGTNHIDWAIEIRDGKPDKVITEEACLHAFHTEFGGCEHGSEQVHEGFWFRIDPSSGACP